MSSIKADIRPPLQETCIIVARAWGMTAEDGSVVTQAADGQYMLEIARSFGTASIALVCACREDFSFVTSYRHRIFPNQFLTIQPLRQTVKGSARTRFVAWWSNILAVMRHVRKADCVFVFMSSGLAALSAIAGKLLRKRVFLYSGNDWAVDVELEAQATARRRAGLKVRLVSRLEYLAMWAAHVRLLNSPRLFRDYQHLRGITERVRPITIFTYADATEPRPFGANGRITLCCVGAIIPRKNHEVLFRALALLRRDIPNLLLTLVGAKGDPSYIAHLEHLERELELAGAIRYLGYMATKAKLIEALRSSDIFVLPSLNEGFPRAAWEAMLQGLPCVLSNISNIESELGGQDVCLYCDPKSPQSLADAVRKLVDGVHIRQSIAASGLKYAREVFAETWQDQLGRVLESARNGRGGDERHPLNRDAARH